MNYKFYIFFILLLLNSNVNYYKFYNYPINSKSSIFYS